MIMTNNRPGQTEKLINSLTTQRKTIQKASINNEPPLKHIERLFLILE